MTMQLLPSIDVLGGRVVRLLRGDYDAETIYDDDPVAVARRFADADSRAPTRAGTPPASSHRR